MGWDMMLVHIKSFDDGSPVGGDSYPDLDEWEDQYRSSRAIWVNGKRYGETYPVIETECFPDSSLYLWTVDYYYRPTDFEQARECIAQLEYEGDREFHLKTLALMEKYPDVYYYFTF